MNINSQSQTPLVSIITPTYNRPDYLKQALKSAISQTYQNIEIIVSDNCSPENPQAIVESFNDPRIRFSRNETNLGMLPNTIKAFKMARGKYVAALLDDDLWEEDFLAKLVPPLEANPNLVLAFCDHYVINADGTIDYELTEHCSQLFKRAELPEGIYQPFYKLGLVDQAVASAMAAVIRKDVIDWDSIPPEVGGSWDVYLTYLCCRTGMGAYYYPQKLTRYRRHDQTETMQSGRLNYQAKIRKSQADMFCLEIFMQDENLQEFKTYFQQQWVKVSTSLGIGLMRSEQTKQARPYLWRSLRQQLNLRTIAALMLSFTPPKIAAKF
ncbi:glycosyltransferase family 2 protein [Fischerella thermalis]|jgi:glycosyltransferase involved in cell wall biosynthesis|uniref:Glycosyl transferase family 2 n=2 Tax=Fischerella TaxID=1190 RepID=G6FZ94_9CYAN|nr:glycosyltransferase family 2 protein [Fischerella thermalis]PLZ75719.1 glycosyl transferase [Fischerella thermalis WC217]PMB11981.1 glycosyltransferase family 2 protein [Fischerella thermalis CCMEE 5273]RDH51885.1 glycosyl transferase [Mastigocladus laminosus WC112]EHC09112.1 glycosyl transferase family 2 [Fischerella thermalis JSC-11]PLZ08717.1 glycosyl transferase [Fischerella thermalis WC119]